MIQSRSVQVLTTLVLAILIIGVTFAAVYFSNQSQILDQTPDDTTEQNPMTVEINQVDCIF